MQTEDMRTEEELAYQKQLQDEEESFDVAAEEYAWRRAQWRSLVAQGRSGRSGARPFWSYFIRWLEQGTRLEKLAAKRLKAALDAPAAEVSDALGITREAAPQRRGYPTQQRLFIDWYCETLLERGLPPDTKLPKSERDAWLSQQPLEIQDRLSESTLLKWAALAREEAADPDSMFYLLRDFECYEDDDCPA
ncbi:hypothetical protein [Motiliproteus sp. SC1-56]|uniref:hypothetical protein n=1 Tax=Motiliproteus sp. SC1-56 TaxID=2799565 RepID=UPI001A8FF8A4|nr:hypothetical protein [Motiliproteus sp. SC1-56]